MKINAKYLRVLVATVLLSGLALLAGSMPVAAAQANSNLTLTYEVQTNRQGDTYVVLLAKLARDDGYPLSQRSIAFFETIDTFGAARVALGSATTTAIGVATLRYETRVTGEHHFTLVYGGDDITSSVVSNVTLDMQNMPALAPLEMPTGMEGISDWTMIAVGVLVLGIWSVLAVVFLGTVRGLRKYSQA